MATQLDLQEQEQVDALKAFWAQYGNLITWTLTLALLAFVGYSFWQKHLRDQATQASVIYDELQRAAGAGDADRAGRVFGDLMDRYPRTLYALQGGLLAARVQSAKARSDAAAASLAWVAEHGDDEYQAVARLRWAGLLADGGKYDDALAQLDQVKLPAFAALASDRRGDVLLMKGRKDEAKVAYQAAWSGMDASVRYRAIVESKLTALAAAPAASATAPGVSK